MYNTNHFMHVVQYGSIQRDKQQKYKVSMLKNKNICLYTYIFHSIK